MTLRTLTTVRRVLVVTAALAFALSIGSFAQAKSDFTVNGSFGAGGQVTGGIGLIEDSAAQSPEIFATDRQGRMIVGAASGRSWQVRRFLPNGNLDRSFGDGGLVMITSWAGIENTSAAVNLSSAVIRPGGEILLVGYLGSSPFSNIREGIAYMVMKQLLPNGSPDLTFGQLNGGKVWSDGSGATDVANRPAGGFMVGAFKQLSVTGRTDDAALLGFMANGRQDEEFASFNQDQSINILGAPRKPSYVFDLKVRPDGRVLVAGMVKNKLLLMGLRADGSYDRTFGKRGRVVLLPGGNQTSAAAAQDLEVDRKGRIVVTGFADARDPDDADFGLVMRFKGDGRPDPTFGKRGLSRLYATPKRSGTSTRLYDVTIDSKHGIWVTGSAGKSSRDERSAISVRYLENGRKDLGFFRRGILRLALGEGSTGSATVRQGQRIYMSGRYYTSGKERYFIRSFQPTG